MMRGGTSRGLFFEAADLPADPAARDDLLLRLMGTPDPRQIDGLGGATTLTSKIAVVGPSDHPEADVDHPDAHVWIRLVTSDSIAVPTFPTPDGRVEYRGDVSIAGVPGTAAQVLLAFTDTEGSATGSLLPTGNVRDTIDG